MKKRILAMLLFAAMLAILLPTAAFAAEYDLYVCAQKVTAENIKTIFGTENVAYDAANHVLSVNDDVTLTYDFSSDREGVIDTAAPDLTINIAAGKTLKIKATYMSGIFVGDYAEDRLGLLKINGNIEIDTTQEVCITAGRIEIKGDLKLKAMHDTAISVGETIELLSGSLSAQTEGGVSAANAGSNIIYPSTHEIAQPEGGSVQEMLQLVALHAVHIVDKNGAPASQVLIAPKAQQPNTDPLVPPSVNPPKTGDTSDAALWFALMIAAGASVAAMLIIRAKRQAN